VTTSDHTLVQQLLLEARLRRGTSTFTRVLNTMVNGVRLGFSPSRASARFQPGVVTPLLTIKVVFLKLVLPHFCARQKVGLQWRNMLDQGKEP
jgi:hypothetical protein